MDYLVKKIYGSSSERSSEDDGQLSLFEEQSSRVFTQPESTGEEIETVKVCKKKKGIVRKSKKTSLSKKK
ncbi:hypothetical protein [Paucilactobacillus hokkaidonensis]|uniref:IS66 family transposase n=1 Tax=Paucilactobacillus hokkaidonensis TaxID=1193095 RepID=UPI0034E1D9B4